MRSTLDNLNADAGSELDASRTLQSHIYRAKQVRLPNAIVKIFSIKRTYLILFYSKTVTRLLWGTN